jgi:hypothetical protein
MNRGFLKFAAALIGTVMVVVPFAGLDSLPRDLRRQIDSERAAITAAQRQVRNAQDDVAHDLQSEPDLFRSLPAAQQWASQLTSASADLQTAARDVEQLNALQRQNRRQDRDRVQSLLGHERSVRSMAVARAADIQKEANHWVDLKKHLPDALAQMERDYRAIHDFDFNPVASTIQKASTDWPEKKADLESRLASIRGLVPESESAWQSTAEARRQAAAGQLANLDYGALFAAADKLHNNAAALPKQTVELQSLSAQLYTAWDKLLVDMEARRNEYRQKIRTVTTRLSDASAKNGQTASDEKWVTVSRAEYDTRKNDLGMAIEHKSAGKYDTEADRVAQPPGFAYMASPAQGSNQYGYWDHRGGQSFWVWYGQYALMRDLLFNRDYRPLDRGDWDGYRLSRERGQTYYGRDESSSGQKYGTQGTATQNRYSGSTFAKGGGFRDSQYASKKGNYRDSQYASPSARDPNADRNPRRFGTGSSRPEERHAAPPSMPSYRPRPAPSYRPSAPRSPGRRFGRR